MMDRVNADCPPPRRRLLSRTNSESVRSLHEHSHISPIVCFVTQPNNNVFQVEIDHRGDVQGVIDKVCKELGIINEEAEYFGLQYATNKNEMIWLNNRNRLSKQVPKSPPYQLYIKVKYFVQPHLLLLEETRYLFYTSAVQQLKNGNWDAETSVEIQAHAIALMAYSQFGKYNKNTTPCRYACFWPDSRGEITAEVIRMAAEEHKRLEESAEQKARYDLLQLVSQNVPSYGTHFCEAKDIFDHRILIGVGPENVITCSSNNTITNKFPYCRINRVTTSHRIVILDLLEDDGSVQARHYKLGSTRLADSLYRLITEVHAFFRCDSVPRHVLQQTTRDLKDTLVSIFDHNGKAFAFDVMHTGREVYDRARRHLYKSTNSTVTRFAGQASCDDRSSGDGDVASGASDGHSVFCETSRPADHSCKATSTAGNTAEPNECSSAPSESLLISQEDLKRLLYARLQELTICRLCMDKSIDRVFTPCGHAISCEQCSQMVEICSICRVTIESRQAFFLPMDLDAVLQEPIVRRSTLGRSTSKSLTIITTDPPLAATGGTKSPNPLTASTSSQSRSAQQQFSPPLPVPSSCNLISQPLTTYLTSRSSSAAPPGAPAGAASAAAFDAHQTGVSSHHEVHSPTHLTASESAKGDTNPDGRDGTPTGLCLTCNSSGTADCSPASQSGQGPDHKAPGSNQEGPPNHPVNTGRCCLRFDVSSEEVKAKPSASVSQALSGVR